MVEIERRIRREYRRWVIPELFVAEVHAFGLRRAGRARADAGVRQLLRSSRVELVFGSPELHGATLELLARHADVSLSYADATGLALAQARSIDQAFTLDQQWAACGISLVA